MDTCYFGRNYGVMVFRDHYRNRNLSWQFVGYETLNDYQTGIKDLESKGWKARAIVCDGKRGLFYCFGSIPIQMCQYHQVAIVKRYVTQNPKLEAGKELKNIVAQLSTSNKNDFKKLLEDWNLKWSEFLREKTFNPDTQKWHFTHRRIRSAYRSLKTNLPFLFTFQDYPDLNIPNTINSLEGVFSNLKTKTRVHAGLKYHRKVKLINEILSN